MKERRNDTIVSEVVAASLGGAISASLLYPLEVIKTKVQARHSVSSNSTTLLKNYDGDDDAEAENDDSGEGNMLSLAQKLYAREGIAVFFRGFQVSAFQSSLEKALYFFSYTILKNIHTSMTGGATMGTFTNLLLGYAAEWSHLPLTLPVDTWTTEIKTSKDDRGAFAILLAMLAKKNTNWYKGIAAYYLLCLKPALQYTVYEQIKNLWLQSSKPRKQALSAMEAFLLGMISRTVATVVVYPFLRAKVLLQTQKTSETTYSNSSTTTFEVIKNQWENAGFRGLFQGLGPELTRGVFSAALMLMIKERMADVVRRGLAPSHDLIPRRR